MSTLTRAETPTQSPCGELYLAGVLASVAGSTLASSPLACRLSSGGEFSVKNTSAGECEPSVTIWSASVSSSSLRMLTVMPVAFSNAATRCLGGLLVLAVVQGDRLGGRAAGMPHRRRPASSAQQAATPATDASQRLPVMTPRPGRTS